MARQVSTGPVRLVDVARRAGVSRVVVGNVLLGSGSTTRVGADTAQRVRRIADEMGYRPNMVARQLRGVRSRMIGVLIGVDMIPVINDRLRDLEHLASGANYNLIVGQIRTSGDHLARYLDDFEGRGVDGVIFLNRLDAHAVSTDIGKQLQRLGPVVFQDHPPIPGACCVTVDRPRGIHLAMEHLHRTGRCRVGLALGSAVSADMIARRTGYEAALRANGTTQREAFIWTPTNEADDTDAAVTALVRDWVVRHQLDAVIASNDFWAVRIIKALKRNGLRVPEDVAVVGFDNIDVATVVEPELTTLDQNNGQVARAMFDLFTELAEKGEVPPAQRHVLIPPRLVVRESA